MEGVETLNPNTKQYKEDTAYFDTRRKLLVKCKCGCSIMIPAYKDKLICRWCKNYVYRDKGEEFKQKLMREVRK